MNENIVPHLSSVSCIRGLQNRPRTPHESHNVVLDVCNTIPPSGQLDVSEQLTHGQGDDVHVVALLWGDGQRVRSQLVVEIGRTCQSVRIVVEKRADLWRAASEHYSRNVQLTYHARNATITSEVIRRPHAIDAGQIQELNERVSDISDGIHDRGGP